MYKFTLLINTHDHPKYHTQNPSYNYFTVPCHSIDSIHDQKPKS
jgi:hypothetical protein